MIRWLVSEVYCALRAANVLEMIFTIALLSAIGGIYAILLASRLPR